MELMRSVNVSFEADVLYMRVNSHVICKMESKVFYIYIRMSLVVDVRET